MLFVKLIVTLPHPTVEEEVKDTVGRGETVTVCDTDAVQPLLSVAVSVVV